MTSSVLLVDGRRRLPERLRQHPISVRLDAQHHGVLALVVVQLRQVLADAHQRRAEALVGGAGGGQAEAVAVGGQVPDDAVLLDSGKS